MQERAPLSHSNPASYHLNRHLPTIRSSLPAVMPASPSPPAAAAPPSNAIARRAALSHVIEALRVDWVRDYLLNLPGVSEAAILASPLQRLHATTFRSEVNHAAMGGAHDPRADFTAISTNVLIPAFSRDARTAFACIEESQKLSGDHPMVPQGFRHCRMVMTEADSSVVGVSRPCPETLLLYAIQIPDTRSSSVQAFVFDRSLLLGLLGRTSAPADYEAALSTALVVSNTRSCFRCGAGVGRPCDCNLGFRFASGSLDFEVIKQRITASFGSYSGFGIQEEFVDGRLEKVVALGTNWRGVHSGEAGDSNRLLSWAIAQSLAESMSHVDALLPPPAVEVAPETRIRSKPEYLSSPAACIVEELDEVSGPALPSASLDGVDLCLGSFDLSDFPDHPTVAPQPPMLPTLPEVAKPWDSFDLVLPAAERPASASPAPSLATCAGLDLPATPFSSLSPQEHSESPQVAVVPQPAPDRSRVVQPVPLPVRVAPLPYPGQPASIWPQPANPQRQLRPIAIAPLDPLARPGAGFPGKNSMELRQIRAFQRKIRNRESAARSNLARKRRKEMQKVQLAKEKGEAHKGLREAVS